MYEAIEHWKEYQKKKKAREEIDKFLYNLIIKNGVTKL